MLTTTSDLCTCNHGKLQEHAHKPEQRTSTRTETTAELSFHQNYEPRRRFSTSQRTTEEKVLCPTTNDPQLTLTRPLLASRAAIFTPRRECKYSHRSMGRASRDGIGIPSQKAFLTKVSVKFLTTSFLVFLSATSHHGRSFSSSDRRIGFTS